MITGGRTVERRRPTRPNRPRSIRTRVGPFHLANNASSIIARRCALEVGVAVLGSLVSLAYRHQLTTALHTGLAGQLPAAVTDPARSSIAAADAVIGQLHATAPVLADALTASAHTAFTTAMTGGFTLAEPSRVSCRLLVGVIIGWWAVGVVPRVGQSRWMFIGLGAG